MEPNTAEKSPGVTSLLAPSWDLLKFIVSSNTKFNGRGTIPDTLM